MAAAPLVSWAPPKLVRVKLACAFEPTATSPKFSAAGETANCAGAMPEPVTALVLLPPLLVKNTALLKFPALAGLKATCTRPVWLEARLNGVPALILKGALVVTAPVRV